MPGRQVDWVARGREHQWQSRPIHALFCFTRAIAERPARANARFHLGEVLWQLGLTGAAKAAWREATAVAPKHLASWLAFTEACLASGDAVEASAAIDVALALEPGNPPARTLRLLTSAALGDPNADWGAFAEAVRSDPGLVAAPARAQLIAAAVDRTAGLPGQQAFFEVLASMPARVPLELLASLVAHGVESSATPAVVASLDTALDEARRRDAVPGAHDAFRRLARAAQSLGRGEAARHLAAAYARACATRFAPAVPLAWPRRTAGAALRVAVLASPDASPAAIAALAALSAPGYDVTLVVLASPDDAKPFAASLPFVAQVVIAAGAVPDPAGARLLASRDPDVVVDAVGLGAATGPWLAQRPGRAIWTLADHEPPLADRRIDASPSALAAARAGRSRPVQGTLTKEVLVARWEAGLRAHQSGEVDAARAAYSALIDDQPDYAPALHFRARLEWDAGDLDAAARDLASALDAAPGYADARVDASRLALERQQPLVAIALAKAGLEREPTHLGLLRALGHALLRLGDGAAAAEAFQRASMLQPFDAETQYNLGVAQQLAGDVKAAVQSYRHASAFDPSFVDAAFNLGVLYQQQGRAADALAAYRQVLDRDPARDAAWKNVGEVLREEGRLDEWAANFRRFEAACPGSLLLAAQALEVCQFTADFPRLDRYLDGLRQERFRAATETTLVDALEELLYLLLFFDVEPSVLHRFAQTYDQACRRVYGVPHARPVTRKPGRLRIGYLSADLRNHVMGKMMWEAVRRHDRERFDVHFYSMSDVRDRWTQRFEGAATAFRDVSGLVDREAARVIDGDDLDLLVDLQTHTKGARPGILALKPARVQITHVASAGTLGLSAIDYKLTDAWADLPEAQEHQIEPLLAMSGCVYPYRAVESAKVPRARKRSRSPRTFVIGAFVTPMKLSRRCLSLWKEIADRLPRARFAFSPIRPGHRPVYERLAVAAGIPADRLLYLPQGRNDAENQARYRVVDVVLDPMPFGNVNGTIEPLAMGVPVVTLVGRRHGERTSYSILSNLGATATIAQSGREYVNLAVRLAEDASFAAEVRETIARGLESSPLVDGAAHTRHLEAAYLAAIGEVVPQALADAGQASLRHSGD
ncbi:MAG: tetratricopeptide repeat protein [Betaproteobacteria bacterium]|nr:tetratricopeptide repeat protein [Betaproteobacteria bacterium]